MDNTNSFNAKVNFYKLWHVDSEQVDHEKVPGFFVKLDETEPHSAFAKIWPYLQEYRIHFKDYDQEEEKYDYIGFVSANFLNKFGENSNNVLVDLLNSSSIYNTDITPIVMSSHDWLNTVERWHSGMKQYIEKYMEFANIDPKFLHIPIPSCNSFIVKRDLYDKAVNVFRQNVIKTFENFEYQLSFNSGGYGDIRKGGCLCERLWGMTIMSQCSTFNPSITNVKWGQFIQ